MGKIRHFHLVLMVPLNGKKGTSVPVLLDPTGSPIVTVTQWVLGAKLAMASLVQSVRHVCYLYDYAHALRLGGKGDDVGSNILVPNCLEALRLGTIDENGNCPLGLFWRPKGEQYTTIRRDLARYADYLLGAGEPINDEPLEGASRTWLRNHGGILNYLSSRSANRSSDRRMSGQNHNSTSYGDYGGAVSAFPTNIIESFIIEGSRRNRRLSDSCLSEYSRTFNVRDQLAKILIFGGGLRSEELFHIFGVDIKRQGGMTDVSLFHPEKGAILGSDDKTNSLSIKRKDYLWEEFRLHPRNKINPKSALYAGWKGLLLLEAKRVNYTKVFWIDKGWGELFWALHKIYVRDYLSRMRLSHPYYFTCINSDKFGQPWTLRAFQASWKAGLARIGLQQQRHSGTAPHGGRHFYGLSAANLGIDPRIRQVMMHHRNILSQLRYQRPSGEQVNQEISQAQKRIIKSLHQNEGGFSSTGGVHLMKSVLDATESEQRGLGHDRSKLEIFSSWFNDPTDPTGLFSSWDFYQNLRNRHGL